MKSSPRVRPSLLRSAVKSSEASDSEQSEEMNCGARHHSRLPETFGHTGQDPSHTAELQYRRNITAPQRMEAPKTI